MDKVLHERVHRHIFISISNHLIPIDMSVGLCASVCARVRTLCAMVIMHVVANFDFIERCTRHNQFTSIEIQCKWFLVHVCLRFFFQLGIARARNALSHTNCTNNRSSTIKYEFKVDADHLEAYIHFLRVDTLVLRYLH